MTKGEIVPTRHFVEADALTCLGRPHYENEDVKAKLPKKSHDTHTKLAGGNVVSSSNTLFDKCGKTVKMDEPMSDSPGRSPKCCPLKNSVLDVKVILLSETDSEYSVKNTTEDDDLSHR